MTGERSLRGADYSDRFTLAASVGADAEQWARAMFGHVPDRRLRLLLATICRFRLRRHVRSDLIGGMTVLDRSAGRVQLGLFGPLLIGRLTVTMSPGEATRVTQLRYATRRGRLIWTLSAPIHRRLAPGLLYEAESRLLRHPEEFAGPPESGDRS